jgi:hypothetical protein
MWCIVVQLIVTTAHHLAITAIWVFMWYLSSQCLSSRGSGLLGYFFLESPKMSEAGLGGLEDLQDFFWNYEKEI